jgi:A/G-specific adenine glycosylase
VLVSEVMLQQTQVARVAPVWHAFLDRFPTVASCAAAPAGEVVQAWAGLGYNRRAVNLHRAATATVARHGGDLPDDLDALLALPGIGPYTARAVLVFAHERDLGLVDTNAGRFVARALAGRPVPLREAQALADAAVPTGRGGRGARPSSTSGLPCAPAVPPGALPAPWRNGAAGRRPGARARPGDGLGRGQRATGPLRRVRAGGGRGRLVAALRAAPVADDDVSLAAACGWVDEPERARRTALGLVRDGLAVLAEGSLRLP